MECNQAYFFLQLRGRGHTEAGPDEFVELERHIAGCPNCSRVARSLAAEDAALARAMTAVPVPDGLRDRLHRNLRTRKSTRRRNGVYRLAAAAASILLCVGITLGITAATRPALDLQTALYNEDVRIENPYETTLQWLKEQKLPERLPPFNMAMFAAQGHLNVQGRSVPVLIFHDSRDAHTRRIAKVLFFRDDQFRDLDKLQPAMSSHFQSRVFRDDKKFPGVTIVVLFTGDLQNFLTEQL